MAMLFRLFLIVTLFAASGLLAPMHGQMAGVSQIEICAETGPETLILDARGVPVGPHQPCPDCVLCLGTAPLPQTGMVQPDPRLAIRIHARSDAASAAGIQAIHPTARGPPASV